MRSCLRASQTSSYSVSRNFRCCDVCLFVATLRCRTLLLASALLFRRRAVAATPCLRCQRLQTLPTCELLKRTITLIKNTSGQALYTLKTMWASCEVTKPSTPHLAINSSRRMRSEAPSLTALISSNPPFPLNTLSI